MSLFSTKILSSREATASGKDGTIYILDNVACSKKKLKELFELVKGDIKGDVSVRHLASLAYKTLAKYHRNAVSCFSSCQTAITADKFFSKWQEGIEWYKRMEPIEQYVQNEIMPSHIGIYKAEERKQIEIRHLIDRVYAKALEKSSERKTEPARIKCFTSSAEKLLAFSKEFDEATLKKFNSKFKKYMST